MQEFLNLTEFNYADLKLTVIAVLVSINKKRDREFFGIKKRDMILQRSFASEADKTRGKVFRSLHAPPTLWKRSKSCSSAGATGQTQTY